MLVPFITNLVPLNRYRSLKVLMPDNQLFFAHNVSSIVFFLNKGSKLALFMEEFEGVVILIIQEFMSDWMTPKLSISSNQLSVLTRMLKVRTIIILHDT